MRWVYVSTDCRPVQNKTGLYSKRVIKIFQSKQFKVILCTLFMRPLVSTLKMSQRAYTEWWKKTVKTRWIGIIQVENEYKVVEHIIRYTFSQTFFNSSFSVSRPPFNRIQLSEKTQLNHWNEERFCENIVEKRVCFGSHRCARSSSFSSVILNELRNSTAIKRANFYSAFLLRYLMICNLNELIKYKHYTELQQKCLSSPAKV